LKLVLWSLLILVLAWGATLWKAARNEAQALRDYPPLGQMIEVAGQQVHYFQDGTGPDVVLIHGASGNMRDFTFDLVDRLSDRYRVTVFDRPGLGYSDPLPGGGASIFDQAAHLAEASAQLGLETPLLVGHSYGGAVALAWATREAGGAAAPSALVLLAAASNPWDTPLSQYYRILSHPVGGWLAAPILSAWVPESTMTDTIAEVFAPQATPEGYSAYIGAGLTLRRASLRENALQRAGILEEIREMVPAYPALALPVEILHGTEDTIVSLSIHSEPLSRQIYGASLFEMEGVGHAPHHVEPGTVTAAIDRAAAAAGLHEGP